MLLGVPVSDVFVKLPRSRGTTGRQLRAFLASRGRASKREQPFRGAWPELAIVRVVWRGPTRRGHWILRARGRFIDPLTRDEFWAVTNGDVTSFIEVLL